MKQSSSSAVSVVPAKSSGRSTTRGSQDLGTKPVPRANTLKFKRPPANYGTQDSTDNQKQTSSAQQNSVLRRVSSAQNQNASVVESLHQFMASRSNSAARSTSQGCLSQTGDESALDQHAQSKGHSKQRFDQNRQRLDKYLRGNSNKNESEERQQSREAARAKPPRSTSQNNTSKQVRFDIKEGLKEMIRDSAPAFNAAQVRQNLMDKKMKRQLAMRSSVDDLKLTSSGMNQQFSDLQGTRNDGEFNQLTRMSPVFGGSHRAQTSTIRKSTSQNQTGTLQTNSSKRQVRSPQSAASSSRKHAYNLALRYQKEVLESKVRKGQIDLSKLNTLETNEQDNGLNTVNDTEEQQQDMTPQSSRVRPPLPIQMTNLIPEVVVAGKAPTSQEKIRGREPRQKSITSHKGAVNERKAGSIFRLRSESPMIEQHRASRSEDNRSNHATCEDDTVDNNMNILEHNLDSRQQEIQPFNRTFYAGQIVKLPKTQQPQPLVTSNLTSQRGEFKPQFAGNSETQSVSYQPMLNNVVSGSALEPNSLVSGRSPSFNQQNIEEATAGLMTTECENEAPNGPKQEHGASLSYVNTTEPISRNDSQRHLQHHLAVKDARAAAPEVLSYCNTTSGQATRERPTPREQTAVVSYVESSQQHFYSNSDESLDAIAHHEEPMNHISSNEAAPSCDMFRSFWDCFHVSEAEFLAQANQASFFVERSKQALHEPLRIDEEAQMVSSARLAKQGLRMPKQRLRLIRLHLRNVLLDSFLPLIHEIIQLRDRLAYRKYTYKLALKQPLKASIISDICSRLKQKIVIKVLFLKSQFKKNLHSLFTAYLDLLVKKSIVRATFDHLRNFKQRQIEKQAYLEYARDQLREIRKVQVFDCMKRFGKIVRLQQEKLRQAENILTQRKMVKLVLSWRVHMVRQRVMQIGEEMSEKFRGMKLRHQLFAKWVNVHRVTNKIKAKALAMINKQQDERREALYDNSELNSEKSSASLQEWSDAQAWLQRVKQQSEELFYRQIQELLLEKEHLQTCIKRLQVKMQSHELDLLIPIQFDRSENPAIWQIPDSQALLSNKEQIYATYPELQKEPLTAIPATLIQHDPAARQGSYPSALTKSVHDLKRALQPPLHKYMVCPQPSLQTLETQENILGTKYSVHQALVEQQNMYGMASTNLRREEKTAELTQMSEFKHSRADGHGLYGNRMSAIDSERTNQFNVQSAVKSQIRVVPFKKQLQLAAANQFSALPQQQLDQLTGVTTERAPNQLFQKLRQQNQQLQKNSTGTAASPMHNKSRLHQPAVGNLTKMVPAKLPTELQLQAHIRNMINLIRDSARDHYGLSATSNPQGRRGGEIRAKALALAMSEASAQFQQEGSIQEPDLMISPAQVTEGMSLTDFTQVAMQSGVSMLHLNEIQVKYRFLDLWRNKLAGRLLEKDLDDYHCIQAGKQALRDWHLHIQKQKLKAVNHRKTKQVQGFYQLFTKWAKATRQLAYETEKQVRQFRSRYVLRMWRRYYAVHGREKKQQKIAIEFYVKMLHSKALAGLCKNKHQLSNCKMFERRQFLVKFFKKRWLLRCRARWLVRSVIHKACLRDQSQDKSRHQRKHDLLKNAISKWVQKVQEKKMLIKTYTALNHYKLSLLSKHFQALKTAPQKTAAVNLLVDRMLNIALQKPFDQLLRVCAAQKLRVREWKLQRQEYICHRFISHLHTMAVKTKIAKLFMQRKYLKALQAHVFRNNYVRPLAFREHHLRLKCFNQLRTTKGKKWQRQRMEIVFRAFCHRKNKQMMDKVLMQLRDYCINEKKDRIIQSTVTDFRKHTLIEKSFKILKYHRMKQRKRALLNQVADEFHAQRIQRSIEAGRTQVHLNTQTGCLLNANQDLLLKIITEWRFISRWLSRNKFKLEMKIKTRRQITLLKCFLGWRSYTRYEMSETTGREGCSKSAISYLEVVDNSSHEIGGPHSHVNTFEAMEIDGAAQRRQRLKHQQVVGRYTLGCESNKSTPALSYINTEQESSPIVARIQQLSRGIAGSRQEIMHKIATESSLSLVQSSANINQSHLGNGGNSKNVYRMSMGQMKAAQRNTRNEQTTPSSLLIQDNSDSTLNARAPPLHLQVSHNNEMHNRISTLLTNPATSDSNNLNQRQQQSRLVEQQQLCHNHHSSVPDYHKVQNVAVDPGMYHDTSEVSSSQQDDSCTLGEGTTGSMESLQQHFGGAVGLGHHANKHAVSAEDTVISPGTLLSKELTDDQEISSKQTTQEQLTIEQLIREHEAIKRCEPVLVTTLHPYNYEIDLPFKQNSANIANAAAQNKHAKSPSAALVGLLQEKSKNLLRPQDYATFSIQDVQRADELHDPEAAEEHQRLLMQRVFSSSTSSQMEDSSASPDYQRKAVLQHQHFHSLDTDD